MNMKRKVLLSIACIFIWISLFSQNYTYTVDARLSDPGNPGGINTDSDISTIGWTEIISGGISTNQWSEVQTLPFSFEFFGYSVTFFKVSANGVLTFDTSAVLIPGANRNLPTSGMPDSSVAFFWDEFTNSPPTGSTDRIYTKVFGTAPNRQLWIKFRSYELGNPYHSSVYLAMALEETTNKIYIG